MGGKDDWIPIFIGMVWGKRKWIPDQVGNDDIYRN
jgi:hypothetical protein